ncbi:hypothetical protein DFH09DRAFT_1325501 [Mycena vulgaris]|nr:hypothetical protein DFH09DRAFT_1325501 [Mycena vulgaris]
MSWVFGTKLTFFTSRKDTWVAVTKQNKVGPFYTKMACLFTLKYGYELANNEDLEHNIADPPDSEADRVLHEVLTTEEAEFCSRHFKRLRERIGAWYRTKYGSLVKSDKAVFAEIFTGVLDDAPPKPTRPQVLHFYSRMFYETQTGEAPLVAISVRPLVTKEVWDEETAGFQQEVTDALEREFQAALKGWRASTLENAAFYLQPFVDAIQQRFGLCVSVLLAGPMLKHGGAIGMQSVHTGQTRGLGPQMWPLHDKLGFKDVEKSMIGFVRECFSDAKCRARPGTGLSPPPPGNAEPSGSYTSTGGDDNGGEIDLSAGAYMTTRPGWRKRDCWRRERAGVDAGAGAGAGAGTSGEGPEDEAAVLQSKIDAVWQRNNHAEWTPELAKAHAAFKRGKGWGWEWTSCVSDFFDFEAAWGFTEDGAQITLKGRPPMVGEWLARARKWNGWWEVLQPEEHPVFGGLLTAPNLSREEWSGMAKLHGRNGLLQVMLTLLWWGDRVGDKGTGAPIDHLQWTSAVMDVTWVLGELLRPGVIKTRAKRIHRNKTTEEEESEGGDGDGSRKRKTRSGDTKKAAAAAEKQKAASSKVKGMKRAAKWR